MALLLGTFLDVEGAFNNVAFKSRKSLKPDIRAFGPSSVNNLIMSLLRNVRNPVKPLLLILILILCFSISVTYLYRASFFPKLLFD